MALGYDEAFADLLWVRTVGYYGAHAKSDRDFTWLTHMLKLIAELDPRYESPYEFAGVILPLKLSLVDEGMAFLEKGMENIPRHNPRYWLQPFYLGFCYMVYKDDALKAAEYFEKAAEFPKSPDYLPLLVSKLYARADKPGVGIDIIQSVLNAKSSDLNEQVNFTKALRRRIDELVSAQYIQILEYAVSDFIKIYHRKPMVLKELVDGLILPFIPDEPNGGAYFLSPDGRTIQSTKVKKAFHVDGAHDNPPIDISAQPHQE